MPDRYRLCFALSLLGAALAGGCRSRGPQDRNSGQTQFVSAPPGTGSSTTVLAGGDGTPGTTPAAGTPAARAVEETDLYRLEGNRLYTLNGYRGLLVFDLTDVDHPRLLGRSPIYGWPVEMVVHGGIATVVVADWYGADAAGKPFHGSVVRGLDARDPAQIKPLGDALLGGWVRDTRVVGEVLYAVSEQWDEQYGVLGGAAAGGGVVVGPGGTGGSTSKPSVVVSSVSFAAGAVQKMGERSFPGWGGVINVTPSAILLAHDTTDPGAGAPPRTTLQYIDISDPAGSIALRGALAVDGRLQGWGPDNGRWNLDFADGRTAHVLGCADNWCGGQGSGLVLSTADFSNPDAPRLLSALRLAGSGWLPAVRFDAGRMFLSPELSGWYNRGATTPLQIYDLTDGANPRLAGATEVPGTVWSFFPQGATVLALGMDASSASGEKVSLSAIDATDPASPRLVSTAAFGDGWAWTPAAGTFKAFTRNDALGMVVLPFSGWSDKTFEYRNGLQLIDVSGATIQTRGAARTSGWVERGIFAAGRLVALSDIALSVIDYSDHLNPRVVTELTLALNVTSALPLGDTIAVASSDFWDNDASQSQLRILPIAQAEEDAADATLSSLTVEGTQARTFQNGKLIYVVTQVRLPTACPPGGTVPGNCWLQSQQVEVVDLSSGTAQPRGKLTLPGQAGYGFYGYGWDGIYWWNWYDGDSLVQVEGDALALRRFSWQLGGKGGAGTDGLYLIDLKNPDAPSLATTTLVSDDSAWWGNLKVVGNALYATHFEWVDKPGGKVQSTVRYFADRLDLSDRAHPRVAARINIPGVLVGGPAADPSLLYVVDYSWDGDHVVNSFDVLRVDGDRATLLGVANLAGYTGRIFLRDQGAVLSVQRYSRDQGSRVAIHQLDLRDPGNPVDRASPEQAGWGWLTGVEGDRAIVTSGWGGAGVDLYRLADSGAPSFDRFVRTRGWWASSLSRQGDELFLSSGYWGVQRIPLAP